jgi:glycosyltransferase involved in cell wall biosynthesis
VGEGPLRGLLEKQIVSLGLQDIVKLRGALPPSETLAAIQAANCLIMPSRRAADGDRDGLPNVLLEAAALGVPIVTTSAGSATDLVDESTGIVVEPGDLEALSAGIGRVFMNSEVTQNRCHAARARVETEFDVEKNVRVLADAFNLVS